MSSTYFQFWNELRGSFPKLDPFQAQNIVNRAWQNIQRRKLWSFLIQDSQLLCPGQLASTGTCNVTQYNPSVTFDSIAKTAINAIPAATPITQQQFRLPGFPVYNIIAWNSGTGTATLDRPFGGPTSTVQPFIIYQCYYTAPAPVGGQPANDPYFRKWLSVYDPINAYALILNKSSQDFDRWDPQRESTENPIFLGYYKVTNGYKLYELWPTPTAQQAYRCKWLQGAAPFASASSTLPDPIDDQILSEQSQFLGCEWAAKMAGTYRELAGTNWNSEKLTHSGEYEKLLRQAIINDGDTMQTELIDNNDSDLSDGYPLTAEWYQHHDVLPGD